MTTNGDGRRRVDLTGIVTAFDWDDDDNVTRVSICADDDEEYVVDDDRRGHELLDCVRAEVTVHGTTYLDDRGTRCLQVVKYTLI